MPGFTGWGVRYRRKCGTSGAGGNVKWGKPGRFESGRDIIGPPENAGCITRGHFHLSAINKIFKEAFHETI